MKTIRVTIEDDLLDELDKFLDGQPRSAFIRKSIESHLKRMKLNVKLKMMEEQEAEAYRKQPLTEEELISPENLYWGEDEDWSDLQGA